MRILVGNKQFANSLSSRLQTGPSEGQGLRTRLVGGNLSKTVERKDVKARARKLDGEESQLIARSLKFMVRLSCRACLRLRRLNHVLRDKGQQKGDPEKITPGGW